MALVRLIYLGLLESFGPPSLYNFMYFLHICCSCSHVGGQLGSHVGSSLLFILPSLHELCMMHAVARAERWMVVKTVFS